MNKRKNGTTAPARLTTETCMKKARSWDTFSQTPILSEMQRLEATQQSLLWVQTARLVEKLYSIHKERAIKQRDVFLSKNSYARSLFELPQLGNGNNVNSKYVDITNKNTEASSAK